MPVKRKILYRSQASSTCCCRIDSLITVDERGQMVLPKEIRERAKIRPGEKMLLISWEQEGKPCCFTLIRADDVSEMVKDLLDPLFKGVFAKAAGQ